VSKTVLAIGAHPDDVEFLMAGTLIHLADRGCSLHITHLANGSCGTSKLDIDEIKRVRSAEAEKAASSIGAAYYPGVADDLQLFYNRRNLSRVGALVRLVAPDLLLVHSPDDYMEDHMIACRLAVTAAFGRGMKNFPVDPETPPIDKKLTVYHAQPHLNRGYLGKTINPDLFVDISTVLERKRKMLMKHESQHSWLDESQRMKSVKNTLVETAREVGRLSRWFEYAEGWRFHHHAGFCDKDSDPLSQMLNGLAFQADEVEDGKKKARKWRLNERDKNWNCWTGLGSRSAYRSLQIDSGRLSDRCLFAPEPRSG
jgi:LmbE family N-acetylglucosaminyl deacetylase